VVICLFGVNMCNDSLGVLQITSGRASGNLQLTSAVITSSTALLDALPSTHNQNWNHVKEYLNDDTRHLRQR